MINDIYEIGMEKYAGDHEAAMEFTKGFLKEAFLGLSAAEIAKGASGGIGKALGAGVIGIGLGLGVHGMSAMMNQASVQNLRGKYEAALGQAISSNQILRNAEPIKVRSYGETVFKFAPHVAADPNLLTSILANAVLGEGIDPMTIRTLTDLEAGVMKARKDAVFAPPKF